jgi:predicted transposase YbfD/YdcC
MNSINFRNIIKFAGNFLFVILERINPVIGVVANILKIVISRTDQRLKKDEIFVANLVNPSIPKELAISIVSGMISDAIETDSLNYAINNSIPFNEIVLKCNICSNYSHYYVYINRDIVCSKCFEKKMEKKIAHSNRLFYFKDDAEDLKSTLNDANEAYKLKSPSDFPNISDKYEKLKRRYNTNG